MRFSMILNIITSELPVAVWYRPKAQCLILVLGLSGTGQTLNVSFWSVVQMEKTQRTAGRAKLKLTQQIN